MFVRDSEGARDSVSLCQRERGWRECVFEREREGGRESVCVRERAGDIR